MSSGYKSLIKFVIFKNICFQSVASLLFIGYFTEQDFNFYSLISCITNHTTQTWLKTSSQAVAIFIKPGLFNTLGEGLSKTKGIIIYCFKIIDSIN